MAKTTTVKSQKTTQTKKSVEMPREQAKIAEGKKKLFGNKKTFVLFAIGIVVLGALLYFGRGFFVAAVVNGQPISRLAVVKAAEQASGQQALQQLMEDTLINQAAQEAKISVTEEDITAEIKILEETVSEQGKDLDTLLAVQGMTRKDLEDYIVRQKKIEKLIGEDIAVTDDEVSEYIEQNKAFLPQDQTEEQVKEFAREGLKQQKLNTKFETLMTDLKNNAKILYFVNY